MQRRRFFFFFCCARIGETKVQTHIAMAMTCVLLHEIRGTGVLKNVITSNETRLSISRGESAPGLWK